MEIEKLIVECKKGHRLAQKQIFERFVSDMLLISRRYVQQTDAAEDVVLTGFYKFFEGIHKFKYENDAATVAWLKKIVINESLIYLRKQNSFLHISGDTETIDLADMSDVLSTMTANEIFNTIIKLPIGYRTVFNLYVIEGMSHKEIAEALKITEGTSKSQLSKARQVLQQLLIKNNSDYEGRKIK